MVKLTIQVPSDLSTRLQPLRDRMAEIIELGLRAITPTRHRLYSEVIEFLASGPTPQEIVEFRPSAEGQDRVTELLDKNQDGALTSAEEAELDEYERLDYLMTVVKARARQRMDANAPLLRE